MVVGASWAKKFWGVEVVDPTPEVPVNFDPPVVMLETGGTGVPGDAVESTVGNWHGVPDSYAYRWQRNGTNITGANGAANPYIIASADLGTTLTCDVTATNVTGSATASSANGYAVP